MAAVSSKITACETDGQPKITTDTVYIFDKLPALSALLVESVQHAMQRQRARLLVNTSCAAWGRKWQVYVQCCCLVHRQGAHL